MKRHRSFSRGGYALLAAVIAVAIFTVLMLKARTMWETEITRDFEEELLFRARQYVMAIELYKKKNVNMQPQNLDILYEQKFLRKRFKDPMTESGAWNIVMRSGTAGGGNELLLVPEEMVPQYIGQAMIIGVCSTSPEEGFLEYRKKKKYNEWAVYEGEQIEKEMPELKYVGEGGVETKAKGSTDTGTTKTDSKGRDTDRDEGDDKGDDDGR